MVFLVQIVYCIMGPKRFHFLNRPKISKVLLIVIGTNLAHTDIIQLDEVGFHLQSNMPIYDHEFPILFSVFEYVLLT